MLFSLVNFLLLISSDTVYVGTEHFESLTLLADDGSGSRSVQTVSNFLPPQTGYSDWRTSRQLDIETTGYWNGFVRFRSSEPQKSQSHLFPLFPRRFKR